MEGKSTLITYPAFKSGGNGVELCLGLGPAN
jgi:hypothetical protein